MGKKTFFIYLFLIAALCTGCGPRGSATGALRPKNAPAGDNTSAAASLSLAAAPIAGANPAPISDANFSVEQSLVPGHIRQSVSTSANFVLESGNASL